MQKIPTSLPDVFLLEPRVFNDARGFFLESYNRKTFTSLGIEAEFVQDNHSRSAKGVLRGLHYQIHRPQGKLLRVISGEVYDVAVDLRRHSPNFGHWTGMRLSAENKLLIWIPPGFAHGFYVLSETAECTYKTTDYYAPEQERCLLWNDPALNIAWPLAGEPLLSDKDRLGIPLGQAEVYA